jgi:hypothetical protein
MKPSKTYLYKIYGEANEHTVRLMQKTGFAETAGRQDLDNEESARVN